MWKLICWLDWPAILSCVIVFGLWQMVKAIRQSAFMLRTNVVSENKDEEEE